MARKKREKMRPAEFQAKVALEALRSSADLEKIAAKYRIPATVVAEWLEQLIKGAPLVFRKRSRGKAKSEEDLAALRS